MKKTTLIAVLVAVALPTAPGMAQPTVAPIANGHRQRRWSRLDA